MFHDIDQGQTNELVIDVSAGAVEMIRVAKGVATIGGGAVFPELFKMFNIPWDRRVEPRVDMGMDVDNRSEGARRSAIRVKRALI